MSLVAEELSMGSVSWEMETFSNEETNESSTLGASIGVAASELLLDLSSLERVKAFPVSGESSSIDSIRLFISNFFEARWIDELAIVLAMIGLDVLCGAGKQRSTLSLIRIQRETEG